MIFKDFFTNDNYINNYLLAVRSSLDNNNNNDFVITNKTISYISFFEK